ncbi:MAG: response regulator [Deltaproteobacteria bacterium]|nr:response regulator [Deltaproteobacteria bacterium]
MSLLFHQGSTSHPDPSLIKQEILSIGDFIERIQEIGVLTDTIEKPGRRKHRMSDTVLFVDDQEKVLSNVNQLFADAGIKVLSASSAREALDFFGEQEIAVIVSDIKTPGLQGTDLLSEIRQLSPDTLKILMTEHADLNVAVDAINRGEVFRFIIKPLDNDELVHIIEEAVERYKLVQSLKKGDEAALLSLAQRIELKDPYTRGHCESVARYALMIAGALHLPDEVTRDIRQGSWLHDCGKIGVADNVLNKQGPLDEDEFEIIKNHPRWGADIAQQAYLSETIVNVILHHHEKYDGSGYPYGIRGNAIPFAARIVAIADVYDALTTDRPYRDKFSDEKAIKIMQLMEGNVFDPEILDVFLYDCLKCD